MANFQIVREVIALCREAKVSTMIWGHRGIGKSSLVEQICEKGDWGYINMRLSEVEASDLRGLPDKANGRTVYLPPADMPIGTMNFEQIQKELEGLEGDEYLHKWHQLQPMYENGILFLDEINRAQSDVLQSAFELVLDRKVGQYVLPNGWSIVCAGNFNDGGYQTSGFMDEAFLDRFCHTTLSTGESTLEEWVHYMTDIHGANAGKVLEFVTQDLSKLDGSIEGDHGFSIQPSRRSWDAVIRLIKAFEELNSSGRPVSNDGLTEAMAGLIGRDLALSFDRYDCPVKPIQILKNGVKAMHSELKGLTRNQLVGLMWGLVSYTKDKVHSDEDTAEKVIDFAEWMVHESAERDLIVAFLKNLTSGNDIASKAVTNPKLAEILLKVRKRKSTGKKSFVERIREREGLHELIGSIGWGE